MNKQMLAVVRAIGLCALVAIIAIAVSGARG
jgi:hypothetical protein